MDTPFRHVVALSGGVGGARLVHGLAAALPEGALTVVVNTGDDFEHWGLHIAPDLDTVMYTLADLAPVERGWGLAEESFGALEMVRRYGGEDWFALGDRDLGTHLLRSEGLRAGRSLTEVTERLARALGVTVPLLPMADGRVRTRIVTRDLGELPFQDWLVLHRGVPRVRAVRFEGDPPATPAVLAALAAADLVVIGPSNPYVSIDPILTRPGFRAALTGKPVVAVSPLVGGRAVKGPLAEMIPDLAGAAPGAAAILEHYAPLLSLLAVEPGDACDARCFETPTVMSTRAASRVLATALLAAAARLPGIGA